MLILTRPWTRQPQTAVSVNTKHAGKIIGLWNTASPGGIIYDAAGGYHAPASGRLVTSDRGLVWNGARSTYATTTRALPALAAGTPYLLGVWFKADYSDQNADALIKVGAWQGGAVPYSAACTIYCNVSQVATAGGLYVGTYGLDFKSTTGGHVLAGVWTHVTVLYDGGITHSGNPSYTLYTAPWTLSVNGVSLGIVDAGGVNTAAATQAQIYADVATIGDEDQRTLAARGKIGPAIFATGPVQYLRNLARQHYENPYALLRDRSITIPMATAGGSFQAAWARNRNTVIGSGVIR